MYSYLSEISPDYSATYLSVTPNGAVLSTKPKKKQKAIFTDGGGEEVNSYADNWHFYQSIPWDILTDTDKETIVDFYFDPLKAKGTNRSFVWEHPTDGYYYVAYFMNDLSWGQSPASIFSLSGVILKVVGYYVASPATGCAFIDRTSNGFIDRTSNGFVDR